MVCLVQSLFSGQHSVHDVAGTTSFAFAFRWNTGIRTRCMVRVLHKDANLCIPLTDELHIRAPYDPKGGLLRCERCGNLVKSAIELRPEREILSTSVVRTSYRFTHRPSPYGPRPLLCPCRGTFEMCSVLLWDILAHMGNYAQICNSLCDSLNHKCKCFFWRFAQGIRVPAGLNAARV